MALPLRRGADVRYGRRGTCDRDPVWGQHARRRDGRASDHVVVDSADGTGRQPPSQRGANAIVAIAGVPLAIRFGSSSAGPVQSLGRRSSAAPGVDIKCLRTWAGIYGLSGFLALSLESSVPDHRRDDEILVVHVWDAARRLPGGLALGAAAGSLLRREAVACPAFLLLQTAIGIYAGISVMALLAILEPPPQPGGCTNTSQVRGDERTPGADPVRRRVPATLRRPPIALIGRPRS